MWQRQKVSLILSVKHGQRSASEKKNEPYFLMTARKVCSIRSMGCCLQRLLVECSTYLPCCSGVKRSFAPGQFRHVCGIHSNAVYGENWRKGWKQRTSNHRRYHFTGEAEWFAWWLRPMREQSEKMLLLLNRSKSIIYYATNLNSCMLM